MSKPLYNKIDPSSYMELAKQLAINADDSSKRTAADRAYYAAFLTCRDVLASKGYLVPQYNLDDHKSVPQTLKSIEALGSRGNDEERLRSARNRINYDTRELRDQPQSAVCSINWMITTAQDIINGVQALPKR
jgi:hypothetical protein